MDTNNKQTAYVQIDPSQTQIVPDTLNYAPLPKCEVGVGRVFCPWLEDSTKKPGQLVGFSARTCTLIALEIEDRGNAVAGDHWVKAVSVNTSFKARIHYVRVVFATPQEIAEELQRRTDQELKTEIVEVEPPMSLVINGGNWYPIDTIPTQSFTVGRRAQPDYWKINDGNKRPVGAKKKAKASPSSTTKNVPVRDFVLCHEIGLLPVHMCASKEGKIVHI